MFLQADAAAQGRGAQGAGAGSTAAWSPGKAATGVSFGTRVQIAAHKVARPRAGREERGPPAEPGRQRVTGWAERLGLRG